MIVPHRQRTPILLVLALATSGCSGVESEPSSAGLPNLDEIPKLSLEEVQRIGSLDDPDYGFSNIRGVEVDETGDVWVVEAVDQEIRRYSPTGELLARVGGPGEGPGEFATGFLQFGVRGDTVWAFDSRARRLTLFDRNGAVRSARSVDRIEVPLHFPEQTTSISPEAMDRDGLFVGDRGGTFSMRDNSGVTPKDTVMIPRIRFDSEGRVVDTVGSYPEPRRVSDFEVLDVGSSSFLIPQPLPSTRLIIPTVEGVVYLDRQLPEDGGVVRILRVGHAGDTIHDRSFTYTPKPYPPAVIEEAIDRQIQVGSLTLLTVEGGVQQHQRRAEDTLPARNRLRGAIDFPEFQSPVQRHLLTHGDVLWLQRERMGDGTATYALFDLQDQPVGELTIPEEVSISWTDGETLWATERDDLGVPWLVEYRIVRP